MNGRLRFALAYMLCALLTGGLVGSGGCPGQAGRRDALGALRDAAPCLVRSGRGVGTADAVLGPLRASRRAREADARQHAEPQPGGVVDGQRRPAGLRVQAARGAQVPQRRFLHRRGREVQLPPREGLQDPPRQGPGGGGGRARSRALRPSRALAGLHNLLRHHPVRGGLDRAQDLRRAGGRRRLQEGARRARSLQVRQLHTRHRAGDGSERRLLAEGPLGEAARLQDRAGEHDAAGHAEARRGRHRLPARSARKRRRSSATPTSSWPSPAASPSSTSTSSTSGTRSRRGTTGACGWPRTTPSTARR